jgi:hypothetical protein
MPSVVLKKISQPQQISEADLYNRSSPISYIEWVKNNIGIVPEDTQTQYEQYLDAFYRQKQTETSTQVNQIREDYLSLVKRLAVIFKNDAEFERFSKINFDSPAELQLAIPYFAKKLREIALYYVNVRENLKKTKLQYATVGSETGLERFVYNKLLESFSVNIPLTNTDTAISNISFDDIKDVLKIEIEELFEDHNYFHDDALESNPLFCVLDNLIFNICQTPDIFALSTSTDPLRRQYLCEEDKLTPNQLITEGWENYVGNDLYYLTGGEAIPNLIDVNLDFKIGNNFFYWFSGETVFEIPEGVYSSLEISAINWDDATAATNINEADIIFTSYGNLKTEGAWLMSADKTSFVCDMTATMFDGKEFKFPYPGHGLSAEYGEWTGRMITDLTDDDKRFFPNELAFQENKKEIDKLYWSDATTASSSDPVFIQDLTLWESGAKPSTSFKQADKLIIRSNTGTDRLHDTTPNSVYWGNLDVAWLYSFNKTQLPIVTETTNIYFPLTAFSNSEDLYFKYESGTDIVLSAVKVNGAFSGAVAGDDLSTSDMIIKKRTICGPELEAAWLEGTPLSSFRNDDPSFCVCDEEDRFVSSTDWEFSKGVTQPSISFSVEPNNSIKFVWTGPDAVISDIKGFNGFNHDDACPYKQLDHSKSILDTDFLNFNVNVAEKWRKCSCRSVYHSPLGQKADNIDFFKFDPDLVLLDTNPEKSFNISEWRGRDGLTYKQSSDVTWYKIDDGSLDKDVGWGQGSWTNRLVFETGKTYIYYRSNLNRCDFEVPPFVINECYSEITTKCDKQSNIPVWRKAIQNVDGEWEKTDDVSDMILESGIFYDYIHRPNSVWEKSKLQIDGADVTSDVFVVVEKATDKYSFKKATNTTPSVEFLIKIDLLDNIPYWGLATYEYSSATKLKNISRNYDDNRLVGKYLISNQPEPSRVILDDSTVIRYESFECNDCFIWKQPITLNVKTPVRQWNKIYFDECVKSDILTYLHNNCNGPCSDSNTPCGCGAICSSVKTGVTATNIPSDMIFNVEMSGVPLFVNYFARDRYTLSFQVEDILNPLYTDVLSGLLVSPTEPWRNLINDLNANFVTTQDADNLRSVYELGLFHPEKVGIGKYELHNAESERITSDQTIFRVDNYFDGPYSPIHINSEWMKKTNGEPLVNDHQTFYPYRSTHSKLGLYDVSYPISPWDDTASYISENFRNQSIITCGNENAYTQLLEITGNVTQWQTDIYGNQWFLVNDEYTRYQDSGVGNLFFKVDNDLFGIDALSSIFFEYNNIFR